MLLSLQSMPNRKTRKRLPHCWQDLYIRMNIYIMKDVLSIIKVAYRTTDCDTFIGWSVVFVTSYESTATGNPLASASPGINGLKPFTLTFTDRLLSDKETCPKGYAASNEACSKRGRP